MVKNQWLGLAFISSALFTLFHSASTFAQTSPPASIPVRLEAEYPVSFYDTTGGNSGNTQCTSSDLDTEFTGDVGGGCNVGWTTPGEWLEYSITSSQPQDLLLVLRVAAARSGRALHAELNGVNVTGSITVPAGGWQNYSDASVPVSFPAGDHTLRIVFDSGSVNLNYIDIIEIPEPEIIEPFVIPARIEAEDFHTYYETTPGNSGTHSCGTGDVDIQTTGDVDGVCNIGWTASGEWLGYTVQTLEEGKYDVALRVASAVSGRLVQLEVDGVLQPDTFVVPMQGWQTYNNLLTSVYLTEGEHHIKVLFPNGSVNLNYLNFTGVTPAFMDADADGIADAEDQCPQTPETEAADVVGCGWSQLDDDNDGITNASDLCPASTVGFPVNAEGCGEYDLDDDNDGYSNAEDACANTPEGEPILQVGCSASQWDSDGDGVNDDADQCFSTPQGEMVNADGCAATELDSDNDGFTDAVDACPNTPAGEPMVVDGCSVSQWDEDSDGVFDHVDMCPQTPLDETADEVGCSINQHDADGDGVADANDLCPNTPFDFVRPVTAYGCFAWDDEDSDQLPNLEDACPFVAGFVETSGCAPLYGDFDADGVEDTIDECPYSKYDRVTESVDGLGCGPMDFADDDGDGATNGQDMCSNTSWAGAGVYGCDHIQLKDDDGDGVINGVDMCPMDFGPKAHNGCLDVMASGDPMDADGDGVMNNNDHCPFSPNASATLVGPNGCLQYPGEEDSDQDGVLDNNDLCPHSLLGHAVKFDGCSKAQAPQLQDTDGDGVNDVIDQCPDFPGEGRLLGCAWDADNDGIGDVNDACPSEPGHRLLGGCAQPTLGAWPHIDDADGDGMPWFEDQCLYSLEPVVDTSVMNEFGCAGKDFLDYDADGVINGQDLCPNSKGSAFTDAQGCDDWDRVDIDQDGVMNGVDLCPQEFGLPAFNGCAGNGAPHSEDADGDGVFNRLDQCPYTPEASMFDVNPDTGCTVQAFMADTDGDGVLNESDQCPNTPKHWFVEVYNPASGNFELHSGCHPSEVDMSEFDMDNDGINDSVDMCPDTPEGNAVDARGCFSNDSDGDNVPNDMDECPGSQRARAMEWNGCEISTTPQVIGAVVARRDTNVPEDIQLYQVEAQDLQWGEKAPADTSFVEFINATVEIPGVDVIDGPVLGIDFSTMEPLVKRSFVAQVRLADGTLSNWFTVSMPGSGGGFADMSRILINDPAVLQQADISLLQAFDLLARNNSSAFGIQLFRQMWDSQRSFSHFGLPFFCEGQVNNYPIVCDRSETDVALWDDFMAQMEMDSYRLTAVVNRLDLRNNWDDCGEHRLVFAKDPSSGGRNFINIEARLPNPMLGSIEGCRPVIEFWSALPSLPAQEQAMAINNAFYGALPGFMPIISPEHFEYAGSDSSMPGPSPIVPDQIAPGQIASGQIRTTQFSGGEWLFKEHKLEELCDGMGCNYWARTVTVKENPFGPLFNPNVADDPFLPYAQQAMDFQQWFPQNLGSLVSPALADLKNPVPDEFNHGQSHASGIEREENDYSLQFGDQLGSQFGMALEQAVMFETNADGSPLMVDQVLARATAMTCAGCHAPIEFGLELPNRIGTLALPNGEIIDAWPQADFVHIDENGTLSPALEQVFLPMRQSLFSDVLEELNSF